MKKLTKLISCLVLGSLLVAANIASADTTIFKTRKNGTVIICGLVNGKYVPGSGTSKKFTTTSSAIGALKNKKDAKSRAKLAKLKSYQSLAAAVCRKGPQNGGGDATAGKAVFTNNCSGCHASASRFKGFSKSTITAANMPPSGPLSATDLTNLVAYFASL